MTEHTDLAGKVVVVTGASSGIGRGTAVRLAGHGARVVLAARRRDVLDEVVAEIAADGGTALAVETDVSDAAAVEALGRAAVEVFGRIDIWVNDVGVGALGLFWDVPVADHARVVDVNVNGVIYGSHVALRQFRQQGAGVLLNVGSVESDVPLAYQSSYAASKAAVLSIGRSLAEELRLTGEDQTISVGTVMPWAVDTPWWEHAANYTGHAPRMLAMDDTSVVVDTIVDACLDPAGEHRAGGKAAVAGVSYDLFPGLTKRLSAKIIDAELERGSRVLDTRGALHEPMPGGTAVDGGVRERMRREDAATAAERDADDA